jgi:pyruvate/oxaloacetate carboxyltransferase
VTEEELARIGESGPEMVYGRYGAPPQLVDEPIIAKMEEGDTVVPLNNNPRNKATMRYRAA